MSTLTDRIARVVDDHWPLDGGNHCDCGWSGFDADIGHAAHVAEQVADEVADHVIDVDTEDDSDPYYAWQELMSHRAHADRTPYGQWVRQELKRYDELQLTEETQWLPIAKDGTRWPPRSQRAAYDALQSFCPDDVADSWKLVDIASERRWVSAWSEVES